MPPTQPRQSLREWFTRHARRPLYIGNAIVVLTGLLFALTVMRENISARQTAIADFLSIAPRAIAQQNRPMLESLLLSLGHRVKATNVGICQEGREVISLLEGGDHCAPEKSLNSVLYETTYVPLAAAESQTVFLIVPRIADFIELAFILFVAIIMIVSNSIIISRVSSGLNRDLVEPLQGTTYDDLRISEVYELLKVKEGAEELRTKLAVSEATREISARVAHDIRSPLSVLNILAAKAKGMVSEERETLVKVSTRIDKIAQDLLSGTRADSEAVSTFPVARLLREIVAEKRVETAGRVQEVTLHEDLPSDEVLAECNPDQFKRIISNLVNNSVESTNSAVNIRIWLSDQDGQVILVIRDDGPGIEPDILSRIGHGKISTKPGGHGIGLESAFAQIRAWGGQVAINSTKDIGTEVRILLTGARSGVTA